jgi:hypothetical protein
MSRSGSVVVVELFFVVVIVLALAQLWKEC